MTTNCLTQRKKLVPVLVVLAEVLQDHNQEAEAKYKMGCNDTQIIGTNQMHVLTIRHKWS